jgi:hypothetical protein
MKTRLVVSSAVLALVPAIAAAGLGSSLHRGAAPRHGVVPRHGPTPPATETVTVDGEALTLGPYTTSDFSTPADPVNLVFLHADPRAIRQELMKLSGDRTIPPYPGGPVFPLAAPFNCLWTDAMGYEQAAFAEPEGWVGGEVQLACVNLGAPLGDPFRFHVRLFRSGRHTFGATHFEIQIPGTAEHEVLSWDFARQFLTLDMMRTGTLPAAPGDVAVVAPGTFREVRRPIYDGVRASAGDEFVTKIGLPLLPDGSTDELVPIPTNGAAATFSPIIRFEPVKSDRTTSHQATYDVNAPKPFCGPGYVHLEGSLRMEMRVQTNPSGKYLRTYRVFGMLRVTPLVPAGPAVDAIVWEAHRGMLTDHYGEVTERASQTLLGEPVQFKAWTFGAGQHDYFWGQVSCEVP